MGRLRILFDASFFYHKLHITLLFCSLNWYRQAFMASETLCLFAFVVNPSPCFHAHSTGGAYHLAKPNMSRQKRVEFHEKMVKTNTTRHVFTFRGAKRSVSDRECKYFPTGMNDASRYGVNWRYCCEVYKVFTVVMYSSQLSNYQLLFLYLTLFICRLIFTFNPQRLCDRIGWGIRSQFFPIGFLGFRIRRRTWIV